MYQCCSCASNVLAQEMQKAKQQQRHHGMKAMREVMVGSRRHGHRKMHMRKDKAPCRRKREEHTGSSCG